MPVGNSVSISSGQEHSPLLINNAQISVSNYMCLDFRVQSVKC